MQVEKRAKVLADSQNWRQEMAEICSDRLVQTEDSLYQQLENQKISLQDTLDALREDLAFAKEEERSALQRVRERVQPMNEGLFFQMLTSLEQQEEKLKNRLVVQKKYQEAIEHDFQRYEKKAGEFDNVIDDLERKLEDEMNNVCRARDELIQLEGAAQDKEHAYQDLSEKCDAFEVEIERRAGDINRKRSEIMDDLNRKKSKLIRNLEEAKREESELRSRVQQSTRYLKQKRKEQQKVLEDVESVKNWNSERKILSGRLAKAKQYFEQESRRYENAVRREEELKYKFLELLGGDDPGDGTGLRAKQLVQGAINKIRSSQDGSTGLELAVEQDYADQLQIEYDNLVKSAKMFQQYRDDLISSLETELTGTVNDGYLKLLRDEWKNLISSF